MKTMRRGEADFILTDPLTWSAFATGRAAGSVMTTALKWLEPAFAEMRRVLADGGFCLSFYGWNAVDRFMQSWRKAGFTVAGHVVFRKPYASSTGCLKRPHEQAYLLRKGKRPVPAHPISDVLDWSYTGNPSIRGKSPPPRSSR